jgi:hypothetical protein
MEFHISWKRQIQDNPEKAKSIYPGDGVSDIGGVEVVKPRKYLA